MSVEEEREKALPRQARLDYLGTMHHVIVRGIEKKRIVRDEQDRYEDRE